MKKIMLSCLLIMAAACSTSEQNTDPREKLKAAFVESLYKAINYDSSKVRYRVDEVIYYEDSKYYDCQFKLTMFRKGYTDTTGSVWAYVSKDFKEVKRTF